MIKRDSLSQGVRSTDSRLQYPCFSTSSVENPVHLGFGIFFRFEASHGFCERDAVSGKLYDR